MYCANHRTASHNKHLVNVALRNLEDFYECASDAHMKAAHSCKLWKKSFSWWILIGVLCIVVLIISCCKAASNKEEKKRQSFSSVSNGVPTARYTVANSYAVAK